MSFTVPNSIHELSLDFPNLQTIYIISAAFIRVVGSEFVQKYLGEGPRMVRDVFRLAKENAPAIIFIDEIDAIATKRFDAQTGADREVQRILLELLNQMDGFDQTTNVKVRFFCFSSSLNGNRELHRTLKTNTRTYTFY